MISETTIRDRIIKEIERIDLIQNHEFELHGETNKWLSLFYQKTGLYKALNIVNGAIREQNDKQSLFKT